MDRGSQEIVKCRTCLSTDFLAILQVCFEHSLYIKPQGMRQPAIRRVCYSFPVAPSDNAKWSTISANLFIVLETTKSQPHLHRHDENIQALWQRGIVVNTLGLVKTALQSPTRLQ